MKKGVILVIIIGILFVVSILAFVTLNLMTQESRIATHKAKRVRAFYATRAGGTLALEQLRKNVWTYGNYYCINGGVDAGVACVATVNDPNIPYNVQIRIWPQYGGSHPIAEVTQIDIKVAY